MIRAMTVALSLWLSAGCALAANQTLTLTCQYDPVESGPGRGTVAGGMGGASFSLLFDLTNGAALFRDGAAFRLTKADADTIEFQEQEFTVAYHRDYGDLISHNTKSGFDGTFHCVTVQRQP